MSDDRKPHIVYPCEWEYRIITTDAALVRKAVAHIVADVPHALADANRSRTGKYCSLSLTLTVNDEAYRDRIFAALRKHPAVVTVL